MAKYEKCSFGYLKNKKKWNLITMLLGLSVILIVFFTGLIVTKSRNNLATVIAILLALPVGKFAVGYFILLPHKSCNLDLYNNVNELAPNLGKLFDSIFSNQKKPIGTEAVVVTGNCVCAYSSDTNLDKELFQNSVREFLKNDKLNVTVSIYTEQKAFLERVKKLQANFNPDVKEDVDRIQWNIESMKNMCL